MKQFETLRYNIIYWAVYESVGWRVRIASPISVHSFSVSEWHESKQTHAKSIITFRQIIQFIYLLIKYNESTQTYTQTHNRFTEQVHRPNEWQRYGGEYAMRTIQTTIWCVMYAFWCCMHTIFCSLCFVVTFFLSVAQLWGFFLLLFFLFVCRTTHTIVWWCDEMISNEFLCHTSKQLRLYLLCELTRKFIRLSV